MKAHLAAIPLVLLEQVSALQPQLDVRGDWAEDVFAALRRDHIRAPLDMTEPRLEPLLDDKGAEDEMAISRCRTFLPGFALVWTSGRGDASSFSATRGNQGSPGGGGRGGQPSSQLSTLLCALCEYATVGATPKGPKHMFTRTESACCLWGWGGVWESE